MKRNSLFLFGLLSAGALAACVTCQAQVYSQGICSFGTIYFDVCSTILPFPPFKFNLTEISWREDEKGLTIVNFEHKVVPGDTLRRYLEVENGPESFFLPLDSGPLSRRFKSRDDLHIERESGDFASVLTKCAANRGSHATTNSLQVIQAGWVRGSRTNEDIFILEGDYFVEIQNLLEQAYGKSDESIRSSNSAGGDCCSINYAPAQIGVFLNVTRTWDDTTIVSIIGKQKP